MNYPDETIYQALFDLLDQTELNGSRAWVTSSRKWQKWSDVSPTNQPALFIREGRQRAAQNEDNGLTEWKLRATVWIYCQHPSDQGSIPSTLINNLLTAVKDQLKPPGGWGDSQRLYTATAPLGLVTNCCIEGDVLIDEGMAPMDTQSIVVIPISIVTGD